MHRFFVYAAICCVIACSQVPEVMAKKGAPVEITNDQPVFDSASNTWHTVVHIQTRTPLDNLQVAISGYRNATLVDGEHKLEVSGLAAGDIQDVPVVVTLDDDAGYLSVIVVTRDSSGNNLQRTAALKISAVDPASSDRKLAKPAGSAGEKLILMPAETN